MYVTITGSGKAKVIQFREDKRIPGTKKKKAKVIKTLGNYERMLAEDPDIITKLKAEAKRLTAEKRESNRPLSLQLASKEIVTTDDVVPSYYFGHCLIKQFWQQMKLDKFFINKCGKKNAETVAQALFYLIAHRCAKPDSIRGCALEQSSFAGLSPLGLDLFYNVLEVLAEQKEAIIAYLCTFFEKKTERKSPDTYLDVTTYAFESTRWGELRFFKNHKNNEVQVVLALLLDNNGIPITYELFPGNTIDQNTLKQTIKKLKTVYHLNKITVVADRGMNEGENLIYLDQNGHDFIISYNLKRADECNKIIYREKVVTQTVKARQVCRAYRGIWKIEESFRILKTDLKACPVFVGNDEHIKGHFMLCFISLCLLRYLQYLLETQCEITASAEVIMKAIREPLALVQGDYPHNIVTPTKVSKIYLELAKLMKLPVLRTNMTLTQFRSSTKLNLNINLR